MPARSSTVGLIHSFNLVGANSAVYNAAANAMGVPTNMAIRVTFRVPTKSGITLYLGMVETGCHSNGDMNIAPTEVSSTAPAMRGHASRAT